MCAGTPVTLPAITEKDKQDLIFGVQQGVDLIAASFVRKADDVKEIRKVCSIFFTLQKYIGSLFIFIGRVRRRPRIFLFGACTQWFFVVVDCGAVGVWCFHGGFESC
jgi:hypothetical protein